MTPEIPLLKAPSDSLRVFQAMIRNSPKYNAEENVQVTNASLVNILKIWMGPGFQV